MKYLMTIALCAVLFSAGVQSTEAKSISWGSGAIPNLTPLLGNGTWLLGASASVTYQANVYNTDTGALVSDGSAVPVGSHINFRPKPFEDTDIWWVGSGAHFDTPYGHWMAGASKVSTAVGESEQFTCTDSTWGPWPCWFPLSVNPPTVSVAHYGTAGLSCDATGKWCTVTSPGSISSQVSFSSTYGYFRYGTYFIFGGFIEPVNPLVTGTGATYTLNVPVQTISFNLTAFNPNQPPTPPTITGPGGLINTSLSFSFTATDPESNTIVFLIDWNNDGLGDQWSSWTSSGGSVSVPHTWLSTGTKTFKALTRDSAGNQSGWAQHTITVVAPDLISENLTVSSGPYFAGSSIALSAGVRNISTTATPAGFSDNFSYRWGFPGIWNNLSYTGKGALGGSGASSDADTFTPNQSGTLYIQHCVDSYNNIPESNEANCTVSAPLTVTQPSGTLSVESPIDVNTTADISWSTSGTSNCTVHVDEPAGVDAWTGASGSKTSKVLYRPTTYTLTCPSYPGILAKETIDVNYEPEVFASPMTVVQDDYTKLTWKIYGQTGCSLSGGDIKNLPILDGEEKITAVHGRTTYTISCPDLLGGPDLIDTVTVGVIPRGYET